MSEQIHTIKFVSQRTGLTQHTIRAWERRYAALTPDRTETNRRLYSSEDLEKLTLLSTAIKAGHTISRIAHLSIPALRGLVAESVAPLHSTRQEPPALPQTAEALLEEARNAIENLDARAIEELLVRATALLGAHAANDRLILPLLRQIGDDWKNGEMRPAHEHLATAAIRSYLGSQLSAAIVPEGAPRVVISTPAGNVHELGALIAAVNAAAEGWNPVYLGPNLPADEIAGVAQRCQARAIALSIVFVADDGYLSNELQMLRKYVGAYIPILVGGPKTAVLDSAIRASSSLYLPDMAALRNYLSALRGTLV